MFTSVLNDTPQSNFILCHKANTAITIQHHLNHVQKQLKSKRKLKLNTSFYLQYAVSINYPNSVLALTKKYMR